MERFIEAVTIDDPKAGKLFIDLLENYSHSELIEAIDTYLDDYDKCIEFLTVLNKLKRINNE
jgi:hypothetical protein